MSGRGLWARQQLHVYLRREWSLIVCCPDSHFWYTSELWKHERKITWLLEPEAIKRCTSFTLDHSGLVTVATTLIPTSWRRKSVPLNLCVCFHYWNPFMPTMAIVMAVVLHLLSQSGDYLFWSVSLPVFNIIVFFFHDKFAFVFLVLYAFMNWSVSFLLVNDAKPPASTKYVSLWSNNIQRPFCLLLSTIPKRNVP